MDYETFRPMKKPAQKQRLFTRNNFAEHNSNFVKKPQTTKPPCKNTQNHLFSQRQNSQQPSSNSVNFNNYPRVSQDQSKNYQFFQQNKNDKQQNRNKLQTAYYTSNLPSSDDEDYYNQNIPQFYQIQRLHSYYVIQQDIFEPYTQEQYI